MIDGDDAERRVDARPEKRFFISMLVKDIELIPAITDLVDNSVDGARALRGDGDYAGLWVEVQAGGETFAIRDNCGGIATDVARKYAFRFGRPSDFDPTPGSVGQFGVGMKRALFKLGKWFEIESRTESTYFLLRQDVDGWAADPDLDWTFRFTEVDDAYRLAPGEEAGTAITLRRLLPSVSADLASDAVIGRLRTSLRLRQQPALERGLRIAVNGEVLVSGQPALLFSEEFAPIRNKFLVPVDGQGVEVDLIAGIVRGQDEDRDEGEAEQFQRPGEAGWYLFCNGRLVLAAERSRLTGWGDVAAAYHPQYRNFRGYVFLWSRDSSLLPWNTTKTGVDEDSPVFRTVQAEMGAALKRVQSVINRLKKERQDQDPGDRPLTAAVMAAREVPVTDLPESASMKFPTLQKTPKRKRQRIGYDVDREDFDRVAEVLGTTIPGDVGRGTFEHYLRTQVQ